MEIFSSYFYEEEIKEFINTSTPTDKYNLQLYKAEENAGWVNFYFKYNEDEFKIFITLAAYDLRELIFFLENIIDLKDETVIFLENEEISTPLLYVCPIDKEKIRFLVADEQRICDLFESDQIDKDDLKGIFDYDIRCDVIIEKKNLLKQFYRGIKNIINNCKVYDGHVYDIEYLAWKDNLKNIISYLKKEEI